jgi:hypothetical protein
MGPVKKQEYKKPEISELSVGVETLSPSYKGTASNESGAMMAQSGIGPS